MVPSLSGTAGQSGPHTAPTLSPSLTDLHSIVASIVGYCLKSFPAIAHQTASKQLDIFKFIKSGTHATAALDGRIRIDSPIPAKWRPKIVANTA